MTGSFARLHLSKKIDGERERERERERDGKKLIKVIYLVPSVNRLISDL